MASYAPKKKTSYGLHTKKKPSDTKNSTNKQITSYTGPIGEGGVPTDLLHPPLATYAPKKPCMARSAPKHAYLHRHDNTTTTTTSTPTTITTITTTTHSNVFNSFLIDFRLSYAYLRYLGTKKTLSG